MNISSSVPGIYSECKHTSIPKILAKFHIGKFLNGFRFAKIHMLTQNHLHRLVGRWVGRLVGRWVGR